MMSKEKVSVYLIKMYILYIGQKKRVEYTVMEKFYCFMLHTYSSLETGVLSDYKLLDV